MVKPLTFIFSTLVFALQMDGIQLSANELAYPSSLEEGDMANVQNEPQESVAPFNSFTGKITKNKVRLRLQPNLDSPILKEMNQGDMVVVVGETEDFYAVHPPSGSKSYVFRTYVLDNVIEASRVNVRLEPDLEAPIVAQLRAGDRIDGHVSALNSKWLEIPPPASARFYIAKDYIEKLGDSSFMGMMEKKKGEINVLLNSAYLASQTELQKSFPEINLDGVYASFNKIINEHKNFPEQAARAKELLSATQDAYLQKKIAYLEVKTKIVQEDWQSKNSQLSEQMKSQQQKMSHLEQQLKKNQSGPFPYVSQGNQSSENVITKKMATWLSVEESLYRDWAFANENKSQNEYYEESGKEAIALKGILEPYNRFIKNKPGDYILVNQSNHGTIAYLYSTRVNLQDKVGQEVTIYGVSRDNHHFYFPAYFVLSIE